MIYRITYVEGDTINKTIDIEASSRQKAMLIFWSSHAEASDVSKVEKVEPEND